MRYNSLTLIFLLVLAAMLSGSFTGALFADNIAPLDDNLLQNGDFKIGGITTLTGWSQLNPSDPVTVGVEGADTYSTVVNPGTLLSGIEQRIELKPEWSKILLKGFIRVIFQKANATTGQPATAPFAGVQFYWVDKSGNRTMASGAESWLATTPGWVEINQLLSVPAGSIALELDPEVNEAQATAYFKDLSLESWISTFQDNFPGDSLDQTKWSITSGQHNVRAFEQQWFVPDDVLVANNMVRIRAEQKQTGTLPYSSGQISTINKFQQLYGLYEFQLKLPVTNGAWPAAYLLAWNDDWPPEIDIEELAGRDPGTVLESNHFTDDYGRRQGSNVNFDADGLDRTQWHTYSVVWEPGHVEWFIDNIYRGTTGEPDAHVSNVPMYMTVNLAVGAFGGDPTQSTWPQDFFCRQVNVYQRNDLPLPLYPEDTQEITLPTNTAPLSAISCSSDSAFYKTWSLIDGPGPVSIRDIHSLNTTATFKKPGMYRFDITTAIGSAKNSAQVLVYVNRALGAG